MATYAIGDVQGCYKELCRLIDIIDFDPDTDKLWFVGDLVNRGPKSAKVLRFVRDLGNRAVVVLGNHDLHTLAVAEGHVKYNRNDSIDDILNAKDSDELLDWLRHRPLMHHSKKLGISMIHAGLPPQWDIKTALRRAKEVESVLQGDDYARFLGKMYGNQPHRWDDTLQGMKRLRFITNCFTRLRYCDAEGNLELEKKGPPSLKNRRYFPWFRIPNRASRNDEIIFGHWSTLGLTISNNIYAIDTGCLWGGNLTALRLEDKKIFTYDCPCRRTPGA